MKNFRKYFLRGSLSHLIPLGAGFIIASSKTVEAALGMSLAITIVTVLSAMIVSALRKVTPEKAHLPIYVLIVTGITTLLCMLMEAYWITGFNALGVHLAALAVSAVPYRDAEELASENGEKKTIICSLVTSLIFAIVMIVRKIIKKRKWLDIPDLNQESLVNLANLFSVKIKFLLAETSHQDNTVTIREESFLSTELS